MAVPTVLTDQDAGAPVLNADIGSVYNVAKWAAGELGWTTVADDSANNRIAIQTNPTGGTGMIYQIHQTVARHAKINGCLGFNTWDDLVDPFPLLTTPSTLRGNYSSSSDAHAYRIIGTNRGMIWVTEIDPGGGFFHVQYFGDYDTFYATDTEAACYMGFNDDSYSVSGYINSLMGEGNNRTCGFMPSAGNGLVRPSAARARDFYGEQSQGFGDTDGTYPNPFTGGVWFERVLVADESAILRGHLPGLVRPNQLTSLRGTWSPLQIVTIQVDGVGKDFMFVPVDPTGSWGQVFRTANALIDLSGDYWI